MIKIIWLFAALYWLHIHLSLKQRFQVSGARLTTKTAFNSSSSNATEVSECSTAFLTDTERDSRVCVGGFGTFVASSRL